MNAIQRYKGNYLLVLRTKNSAFHGSAYICRLAKLVCQTDNNFAGSVVSLFTLYDTSVYSACTSSYKQWAADVHASFRNVLFHIIPPSVITSSSQRLCMALVTSDPLDTDHWKFDKMLSYHGKKRHGKKNKVLVMLCCGNSNSAVYTSCYFKLWDWE